MNISKIIEDIKLTVYIALSLVGALAMATFLMYGAIEIYKLL
tara:strand:+ start:299 stop:424 length:126 start_codon:yes stop_codon:yes gene_type:complete